MMTPDPMMPLTDEQVHDRDYEQGLVDGFAAPDWTEPARETGSFAWRVGYRNALYERKKQAAARVADQRRTTQ